jgi:integrase/recombinase XerD
MAGDVRVLIGRADRLLAGSGRPETSAGHYRRVWAAFGRFCDREGIVEPVPDHIAMFLIDDGADVNALTEWQRFKRRAVACLFAIDETGAFPGPLGAGKQGVPARFADELGAYEQWLAGRRLATSTVGKKRWVLVRFLRFLDDVGVPALAELRAADAYGFLAAGSGWAASTRATVLFSLREYLRFGARRGVVDPSLGELFPVIVARPEAVLPSVFTPGEVAAALDGLGAVPPRDPWARRDRAVFLLASVLGMRAGNIAALRLSQIDWRTRRISVPQVKTGRRVDLPMPEEVMLALLDYVKHDRHAGDDDHVFLRAQAPFGPHPGARAFYHVVANAFARAGIDVTGRRHGPHALRHSLASSMLAGGTPYPAIGAVLGHAGTESTKSYLRIDVEHLRGLALEVPSAC